MWIFGKSNPSNNGRRGKRGEDRFTTDLLTTELGEVLDLSGSGMRIGCTGRLPAVGQIMSVTLKSTQCHVTLKCRVVRVKRKGLRAAEIGLKFVEIKPGLKTALHNLARFGFIPRIQASSTDSSSASGTQGQRRSKKPVPDYYQILGVGPAASTMDIRRAYHDLAHKYHPDASPSPESAAKFQAVAEAYKVLRDSQSRKEYDELRSISIADAA